MADNKKLINVEGLSKVALGIKGYVDKKDQAMNERMEAVEGAKHTHDNAEELAKVVDGKVAAWDAKAEVSAVQAAQQAAEGKAAELVKGLQEGTVAKNTTDLRAAEGRLDALEGLVVGGEGEGIAAILADVAALKTAVGDANSGLVAEMDAAEGRLDALDGEAGRMAAVEGRLDALDGEEGRMAAVEDAIDVLNGEGEGSVKKAVADGIATVVANADADFDTLKEVADWIMTDGTNAAALQTQVGANKDAIAVLNGDGVGSVTKAVADEAALRDAGDKAVEGKITSEETRAKGEEARIEGLVTAEATTRQQADEALGGRIDGVVTRIEALEGVDHNHDNKEVLDGIDAAKVQAWDGKAEVADVEAAQGAAVAAQGTADQAVQAAATADGKAVAAQQAAEAAAGAVSTLRTDMVAVFNALDLKYEDNKVKLYLPNGEQSGVGTPLGEAELPVLTGEEADALLVELGLVGE